MTETSRCMCLAVLIGLFSGPALAANDGAPIARTDNAAPAAVEDAQPRRGKLSLSGRTIGYTVTPGTLVIRNDDNEPIASMFYVAYVADRPKGAPERPVTFLFNGGPGSSSMFLHIGSIAPMRIDFPRGTEIAPAPYRITENPFSLIDKTDLVFLDMVGAGLSRPLGTAKDADFWSVDRDVDAFALGIKRYLTLNKRWNSPKFLFGESYGTTRATGLAYKLSTLGGGGIKLNGIILLGVNLNHGIYQPGFDESYISWLPSYAATAWHHHRLPARPATLEPFLTEVRAWARGPYASVLAKGYEASDEERRNIARQYSLFTGLPEQLVLDANLRVELATFRKQLLLNEGLTVGRLDSRFTGQDNSGQGGEPEYDATSSFNAGPFAAGINHYLFDTLGYQTDLAYRPNAYARLQGRWDRSHTGPSGAKMALANTALDLAQTMRENRHLKVLVLNGYYDLATPFFKAEYDITRMQIDRQLQRNIRFEYFESGHMIYTNTDVMPAFKSALDRFYDGATRGSGAPSPARSQN